MADESRVSPAERAKIDFEIALVGKAIEAQGAKGIAQRDCGAKCYQKTKAWVTPGSIRTKIYERVFLKSRKLHLIYFQMCGKLPCKR